MVERVPGSDVWWIRWTDHQGKRHLEKAGRHGDAVDLLAKRRSNKLLKKKLPEKLRGKVLTFADLAKDALAHSKEQNGERSTNEIKLKLAIIGETFDSRPAEGISKKDIQDWLLEQTDEREWSPATRNRYQAAFSLTFRVAVDNDKLTVNPASKIKRKAEHNDRIRFLSDTEEERLAKVIREKWPHYLPVFLFSLHVGCRSSEQLGLRWADVDLDQKIVTFAKTKSERTRHVPLNDVALAALESIKGQRDPNAFVFVNTEGNALRSSRDWFEPAVAEAEVRAYTWHCNRHTFASRLVMAGVDIRTVAYLMGHATIQMTMRYAHLAPDHNRDAVARLVTTGNKLVTKSATGDKARSSVERRIGGKLKKNK